MTVTTPRESARLGMAAALWHDEIGRSPANVPRNFVDWKHLERMVFYHVAGVNPFGRGADHQLSSNLCDSLRVTADGLLP